MTIAAAGMNRTPAAAETRLMPLRGIGRFFTFFQS